MADATAPISTPEKPGDIIHLAVAAATAIYAGVLAAVNATGYLVQAADAANLRVVGKAEQDGLNADGANGDVSINIRRGCFLLANSDGDPVTVAHIGKACYVEDSVIVSSDPGDHSIVAGRVAAVTAEGVWVDVRDAAALQESVNLDIRVAALEAAV